MSYKYVCINDWTNEHASCQYLRRSLWTVHRLPGAYVTWMHLPPVLVATWILERSSRYKTEWKSRINGIRETEFYGLRPRYFVNRNTAATFWWQRWDFRSYIIRTLHLWRDWWPQIERGKGKRSAENATLKWTILMPTGRRATICRLSIWSRNNTLRLFKSREKLRKSHPKFLSSIPPTNHTFNCPFYTVYWLTDNGLRQQPRRFCSHSTCDTRCSVTKLQLICRIGCVRYNDRRNRSGLWWCGAARRSCFLIKTSKIYGCSSSVDMKISTPFMKRPFTWSPWSSVPRWTRSSRLPWWLAVNWSGSTWPLGVIYLTTHYQVWPLCRCQCPATQFLCPFPSHRIPLVHMHPTRRQRPNLG